MEDGFVKTEATVGEVRKTIQILAYFYLAEEYIKYPFWFNSPSFKQKKPQCALREELEWRLKHCSILTRTLCTSNKTECVLQEQLCAFVQFEFTSLSWRKFLCRNSVAVANLPCSVLYRHNFPAPDLVVAGKLGYQDLKGYKARRYILFFSSAERTPCKIKVTGF